MATIRLPILDSSRRRFFVTFAFSSINIFIKLYKCNMEENQEEKERESKNETRVKNVEYKGMYVA